MFGLLANLELALTTGALIVTLVAGAFAVYWAKHWRQRLHKGTPSSINDLANFRALYEQGKLTRAEFNSIVQTLAQRAAEQAEEEQVRPSPTIHEKR